MRITRLYFLLLFIPIAVTGQDISGKWTGSLIQTKAYKMDMNIFQRGKVLSGTSRFSAEDGSFVEERFTGTIDGSDLTINETDIVVCPDDLTCALKKMVAVYKTGLSGKKPVIEGSWTSNKIYQNHQFVAAAPARGTFTLSRVGSNTVVQLPDERPRDGYYTKTNTINARVTPLPVLREADVVYSRRIWREIDLREKMNQYLASPKARLIDILMDAIASGEVTAYDPAPTKYDTDGDAFATPLPPELAKLKMADSSAVSTFDKNGDKTGSKMVAGEFNPDSVYKFRLKEDVIFDKQRSVQEIRIIGIAPLIRKKIDGGAGGVNIQSDYQPAFWIYFPQARQVLVNHEAVNSRNDAAGITFDDVFTKRIFTSYIVKQSNDNNERIKDYAKGIDRLYESEKIKKSLMDWELNLWQY